MRRFPRGVGLLLAIGLPAAVGTAQAADNTLPLNAVVAISDTGFTPSSVTIAAGGSVAWNNQGLVGHSVDTLSAPFPIYMGVSAGQSATFTFNLAGTYHYTAATDCLNGVSKPQFNCGDNTVIVVAAPPGAAVPATAAPPTPTPTPTPSAAPQGVVSNGTIDISDSGFSPRSLTVTLGGNVTWTNHGANVHTVSGRAAGLPALDSGGLSQGQTWNSSFSTPGTYSYTSETDCLDGNRVLGFDCGPYTLVVTSAAPSATSAVPAGVAPASNTTIGIDDTHGFQPSTLTIKLGQSVTWVNNGVNVHSAVSSTAGTPAFDSGGLGPGQSFSWAPPAAGTYYFKSVTDAVFVMDPVCNCQSATYPFTGKLVVGQ